MIARWAEITRVEQFLASVEARAGQLESAERANVEERLRLARDFLGRQEPLDFFREWKTPAEQYQPRYGDEPDQDPSDRDCPGCWRKRKTRPDRHSGHPDHSCGEEYEAGEVDCSAFVACCEAAEVFEAVEASLDAIAMPIGGNVMRDGDFAGAVEGITASAPISAMMMRKALLS